MADDWVAVDDWVEEAETPKKSLWQKSTTPISKIITGKSIGERTNLLEKSGQALADKAGRQVSVGEAFIKQLPAATTQALINFFDFTPLDIGIMAATMGAGKIPIKGTTVGQVAKTIPVGKGFMGDVSELGRYEQTLKAMEPFSSRGVAAPVSSASAITPSATGISPVQPLTSGPKESFINLSKYKPEIQEGINKIMNTNPEILARKQVSHVELEAVANQLDSTPIVKKILSLPEGEMAAEILKLRQGEDSIIRMALNDDLNTLGTSLKEALQIRQTQSVGRLATEAGRALEQFKIPIEAQNDLANLINQKILQIKKDPTLQSDDMKRLISGLVDLRKTVLSKDFNPTWFDKGYEFWLNNVLSGPWTHTVNVTSNALFGGVAKPIEKGVYAFWDKIISYGTGKRTHYFSEIPAQMQGFGMALEGKPVMRETTFGGTTSMRPGWEPKNLLPIASGSKLEKKIGAIQGAKGEFIRLPTKALIIEDNFAKRLSGFAELVGRAEAIAKQEGLSGSALIARKNQLIANPTQQLLDQVSKEQLIRTFQDSTGMGEFLKDIPQKGWRWVLPFRKTLASILTKGMERTPATFVKVGIKGAKSLKGIPYPQDEIAVDLGNASIGTGVLVGIMYALKKGTITGSPPRDKAKRDVFYAQGKQPYSILVNGRYIPFSRIEPYGTAAMYMIDFLKGYEESDKEIPVSKLTDAVGRISYSLANKTFMSGMTFLVQAVTDPDRYGEEMITRNLSGFVPAAGLLRNIRQMKDLTVREPEGMVQKIGSNLPGISEMLPARVSSFGQVITRKPTSLSRFVPFPITREENNLIADELARLDLSVGYPSKNIKNIIGNKNEKLTANEYSQLLMRRGGVITKTLENIMSSDYYQKVNDDIKIKIINNIISKIGNFTKEELKLKKFTQVPEEDWVDVK